MGSPERPAEDAGFPAPSAQILACSLVFKPGEQEKITQLPCGSVGARRGHVEFGDLWFNILGMYHRLLCFLSASGWVRWVLTASV